MNQDVAIEVQHISKSFKISYDKSKTLKDKIIFAKKDKYEIHQVLDDVSFTIEKGEAEEDDRSLPVSSRQYQVFLIIK